MAFTPSALWEAFGVTQRAGERYLREVEWPVHHRMADGGFPQIQHACRARGFVREGGG